MVTNNTRKENKQLKRFLNERGMLGAFRRQQNIKFSKSFDIEFENESQKLIAFRRRGSTVVADRFTLRTLLTTKRFNLKNIQDAFQKKTITEKKFSFKGKKEFKIKSTLLRLSEVSSVQLTNVQHTVRTRPIRTQRGSLFVCVKFFGDRGTTGIAEGGSQQPRFLNIPNERQKAFEEAVNGAGSEVGFSWKTFEIIWIHYSYFRQRSEMRGAFK